MAFSKVFSEKSDFFTGREDISDDIRNGWKLLLDKDQIEVVVQGCADYINKNFKGKDIVLTCILKGAVYFLTALSQKLIIKHSLYFIEASSYKDSQTQGDKVAIAGGLVPSKFANKHIILIDELFDNGETIAGVKKHMQKTCEIHPSMIFTCTLFKKKKGVSYLSDDAGLGSAPDLFGIEVPDVWLVGYGLDFKQHCRGWTNLYACPKDEGVKLSPDDELFANDEIYKNICKKMIYL
jgi:hypoxanthine phosphoribosyltransferase